MRMYADTRKVGMMYIGIVRYGGKHEDVTTPKARRSVALGLAAASVRARTGRIMRTKNANRAPKRRRDNG